MSSTADRADIEALFQQLVRAHADTREGIITFCAHSSTRRAIRK
jgi:hypothetical protein